MLVGIIVPCHLISCQIIYSPTHFSKFLFGQAHKMFKCRVAEVINKYLKSFHFWRVEGVSVVAGFVKGDSNLGGAAVVAILN